MSSKIYWSVLLLAATAAPAWPQARFEVASIRPSQPEARVGSMNFHGDRFEAKAVRVGDILDMLNGYQLLRVVGGPDWMRTDRYDIEAKADRPLEVEDRNDAVMALLAERFQLQSHRETRKMDAIVLQAPRTPAGLKQAGADEKFSMRMDRGDFAFTAASMSTLTNRLTQMLMTPVVDETELKATYDFELAISRVESRPGMIWGERVLEAVEAIGFRTENRRIPLEVTVVDRCERPTAN